MNNSLYAAPQPLPLEKGERILFFGDSITEEGDEPRGYVSLVRNSLSEKFPLKGIEVIGAGISGDKVSDLLKRVDYDVLPHKPSLVVIYIGINDVWGFMGAFGTPPERFRADYKELLKKLRPTVPKIALLTLSVLDEKVSNPALDKELDQFSSIIKEIAAENALPVVDLRPAFRNYLKEKNAADRSSGILTRDGVHLNVEGNRLVADEVLSLLGAR